MMIKKGDKVRIVASEDALAGIALERDMANTIITITGISKERLYFEAPYGEFWIRPNMVKPLSWKGRYEN